MVFRNSQVEGLFKPPNHLLKQVINFMSIGNTNTTLAEYGIQANLSVPLSPIETAVFASIAELLAIQQQLDIGNDELVVTIQVMQSVLYAMSTTYAGYVTPLELYSSGEFEEYLSLYTKSLIDSQMQVVREAHLAVSDHLVQYGWLHDHAFISTLDAFIALGDESVGVTNTTKLLWERFVMNQTADGFTHTAFERTTDQIARFNLFSSSLTTANLSMQIPEDVFRFFDDESDAIIYFRLNRLLDQAYEFYLKSTIFSTLAENIGAIYTAALVDDFNANENIRQDYYNVCNPGVCAYTELESWFDVLLQLFAYTSPVLAVWSAVFGGLYLKLYHHDMTKHNKVHVAEAVEDVHADVSHQFHNDDKFVDDDVAASEFFQNLTDEDIRRRFVLLHRRLEALEGKDTPSTPDVVVHDDDDK
jgi:hypothetical protein